jgi:tetratricopeptide (TPR) repeat protein
LCLPLTSSKRAEGKARAALALDPTHIEGRLQLAIALSLKARALSNRAAMRAGYGDETKSLAKAVLEDDPDNKYANGFLAVWHLEARRRGGAIGASMLGASVKKARHHYSKAISTAPGDASIHWQYARALTALNAKKYRQEIDAALDAAMGCSTESQLERIMQDRAQILQSTLIEQKRSQAEEIAARML